MGGAKIHLLSAKCAHLWYEPTGIVTPTLAVSVRISTQPNGVVCWNAEPKLVLKQAQTSHLPTIYSWTVHSSYMSFTLPIDLIGCCEVWTYRLALMEDMCNGEELASSDPIDIKALLQDVNGPASTVHSAAIATEPCD